MAKSLPVSSEEHMEDLKRKVCLLLDDCNEKNLEINVEKVKKLEIDSYQKLSLLINLVFEKAMVLDDSIEVMAKLGHKLMRLKVPDENKPFENAHMLLISK